jgi:hypothetical protein
MNFIINNQENFPTNSSIHSIIKGIRTTFIKQMPIYLLLLLQALQLHCLKVLAFSTTSFNLTRTFYAGIRILHTFPPSVTTLKNDKAKFKAASILLLRSLILTCKDDL